MKFADNTNQAADLLREAIPLMVKYNIPPNPLNYALWYTYASRALPELNQRLDQALETYGTCPNRVGEQMFREHIIHEEVEAANEFENGLLKMVEQLDQQASTTAQSTEDYSAVLEHSLEAFNEANSQSAPLEEVIKELAESTRAVSETTKAFQQQLDAAQAEIEALRTELVKTRQDAHQDQLTGLFNRRVFDTELAQMIESNKTQAFSLIMLDVDHFKSFNDTYGHLMGDKVLQYVGKMLRDSCEEPVLPVRFGGEEFAILMPNKDIDEAYEFAESLRAKIQAIRIRQRRSGDIIRSVTASFGISQMEPGRTDLELIDIADRALYKAKENGRNRSERGFE